MMPDYQSSDIYSTQLDDKEEIISSFENDTFLQKYKNIHSQKCSPTVQLNDLLLWLKSDFVPDLLKEVSVFSNKEVKDCLNKVKKIRSVLSTLQKNMAYHTTKNDFTYTCSTCHVAISGANRSVSVALQQHEHIEEALANLRYINATKIMPESAAPKCYSNIEEALANLRFVNATIMPESAAPKCCSNCLAQLKIPTNFKFSFNISYHPDVEMFLYMRNFTNDIVTIENFNLFTVQRRHNNLCLCLLCIQDFPVSDVKQHFDGRKHAKNKTKMLHVGAFLTYHKNWLLQESCYQAHQVYFNPFSTIETICCLCNNTKISYGSLQDHIRGESHKLQIVGAQNKSLLAQLQKQVYAGTQIQDSFVPVNEEPSTSSQNRKTHVKTENSDCQSDEVSTDVQEEENSTPKVDNQHDVIKSIQTDGSVKLHKFLEHRFWPHFDSIMRLDRDMVICSFCNVQMDKTHDAVIQHILSGKHKKCTQVSKKFYRFYCEICNIWSGYEYNWFSHLKSDKHINWCQRLAESRQKKITEYECTTCRLIFFGDQISINRHIRKSNKGNKPNKITLDKRVNDIFTNEENIIETANRLVKDAEDVLLNFANITECCNAIKECLMETYPTCNVYPFGSQVSGLGSKKSDLDLFVDLGDMYLGNKGQDSTSQVTIVSNVMKLFGKRKTEFQYLNAIPRARTPIVQLYHVNTHLDCDLSFRHGLSVENTKFLRLCILAQPCTQYLILLLKQWFEYTRQTAYRNITTYSLAMMVIFFLQKNKYLIPVHQFNEISHAPQIVIDGWSIMDLSLISADELKKHIKTCDISIKEMLTQFFLYYKSFNYTTDIICPLLGRPIKKSLFTSNPQGFDLPLEMSIYVSKVARNTTDLFKVQSAMCIQDPFDLSHNLSKSCSHTVVDQFRKLCGLSYKLLTSK